MRKGKRIISIILCSCLMVTSLPMSGAAYTGSREMKNQLAMGDADSDGDVDVQDVLVMEKYIAGEKNTGINQGNADITVDGVIDDTDVQLVKDYLVGNIDTLKLETCIVSFNTNGGGELSPITVGKGYSIKTDIPSPAKEGAVFAGWKKSDGSTFYQADAVTDNMTLNAVYEDISYVEQLNIDSFALMDQEPYISFSIEGDFDTAYEVEENITLVAKDGKDPVEIEVTEEAEGKFSVSAKESFTPGGSYALTLGEGLNFVEKDSDIRTANFVIKKEEQDNFVYNNSLVFIKDTEEMKYSLDHEVGTHDMIDVAFLSNDENEQDIISGTFDMTGGSLSVGNVVCIYENIDPRERDYTKSNYDDDSMAYVRIVDIEGDTYSFESLSSEDAGEVIMMPDSIPFQVDTLPTGETGTVNRNDYDAATRVLIGKTEEPEYNVGDFLIFYAVDFDLANENTEVVYGQVAEAVGDTISYKIVTKDYIDSFMGMFVKNEVDGEKILENIDEEEMLAKVEEDAENSGFVAEAVPTMVLSAMESPKTVKKLRANGFTDAEINSLKTMAKSSSTSSADGKLKFFVEHKEIDADFGSGDRFGNGIKVVLWVDLVLSINRKDGDNVNSVKLELNASFEEEVAVSVDADIEDDWDWYLFVPVLNEVTCDISVDIQNFTSASLGIQFYTLLDEYDEEKWEAYTKLTESRKVKEDLRELNNLEAEAEKEQDKDSLKAICEKIKDIKDGMPTVTAGDKEYTFEEVWNELDKEDVADAFANGKSENQEEAKIFMDRLMDKYSGMIQSETDWIELVNVELIDYTYNIYCIAINLKGNFIIRTQTNVSMGANVEYQVGKRYNFWIKILSGTAGSSEMDLIDERFGFQLYIMGAFALRAGVKLSMNIGLISADLASVGACVEFGPYMKLYGYFCYVYTKHRPKSTGTWISDEQMMGALDFEFGLYLIMSFKAQVLNDWKSFEKTLLDKEWPLLTAGQKSSVYGFANDVDEGEVLAVRDEDADSRNGITMKVPERYLMMKTMMLRTGEKKQEAHDAGNYIFSVSDRRFSVDEKGVISAYPSDEERYMEAELTITWKLDKYAFSKYDMTVTVPIVWTNMTTEELNEKFTASVAVGNVTDGYTVVWSDKFGRIDSFDLPTEEEVLELIGYDAYNDGENNLKYSEVGGYKGDSTGLSITSDKVYYFDITKQKYSVEVTGVQNQDGTTESRTYTTTYGEAFDFSELDFTGTDDPENVVHTEFVNLTLAWDDDVVFDINTVVDSTFVEEYGTAAELTANYLDNTHEAVFSFIGIEAPDVTVRFKNNQQPYFESISEYVEEQGVEGAKIDSISPALTKMNRSIRYVVNCSLATPAPKYTFSFDTNGGSSIKSQKYTENSIIFRPSDPVRRGYTFAGWYGDENFSEAFSFDSTMPGEDVIIYAKWTANKYNVTLISSITGKAIVVDSFVATYDEKYGELKAPEKDANYRFEGWYTTPNAEDGVEITSDTIFNEIADVTLYAHWVEKDEISTEAIKAAQVVYTGVYNEAPHSYELQIPKEYAGLEGFVVQVKKENTNSWTSDGQNAGTYSIKITRPTCDYYKKLDEIVMNRMFIINRANLSLGTVKAYRMGKNVVVSLPDGAKGDGKVTYYCGSRSNSTGFFKDVEGSQTCYVTIGTGTNYNSATSGKTSSIQNLGSHANGNYKVSFTIKTGDDAGDGCNFKVYGGLKYRKADGSGEELKEVHLDKDGYNDFQTGDVDEYDIYTAGIEPWQITGYTMDIEDVWPWNPKMTVDWIRINVKDGGGTKWSATHYANKRFGEDGYSHSMNDFKRKVTDTGNLKTTAGASSWNIKDGKDYTFNYDGKITDQYMTYNPFVRFDSPTFTVTSGNSEYDKFIRFTGVTTFKVDGDDLRDYVKVNGGNNFTYTVKLTMPSLTCKGTRTFTRNISVNVAEYVASLSAAKATGTASTYSIKTPIAKSSTTVISAVPEMADANASEESFIDEAADVYNSISSLETDKAEVVNVPISITDKASAWGLLVDVKYDKSVLKLIGYEYDDVFVEDEFTVQKDMTKNHFKFLAVNDSLKDKELEDNILTLKFAKLQDDAPADSYKVVTQLIQAVNVDAEKVNVKFNKYFSAKGAQERIDSQTDKSDNNMEATDKSDVEKMGIVEMNADITDSEDNKAESGAGNSVNNENLMADNSGAAVSDDIKDDSLDEDAEKDENSAKDGSKDDNSKEASAVTKEEPNNLGFIIVTFIILFAAGFCGVVFFTRKKKMQG